MALRSGVPVDAKTVRAALRARDRADRAEAEAVRLEQAAGIDWRAIGIANGKLTPTADAAHRAILKRMTVATAAILCGTTEGLLKQSWSTGPNFRPARASWRRALAAFGVPRSAWRDRP